MTVYEFANKYLGQYKTKGNEIIPLYCPFCKGGQKKDRETFALNVVNQTFNCKRGTCGKQGHFTQLCREFGEQADSDRPQYQPKQYKKPTTEIHTPTDTVKTYLKLRGISVKTQDAYKISADKDGNILFPFYDDKDELVFVKFRPAHKIEKGQRKAWRETDTKPILFGMNLCDKAKPLCIFEGEIDAMSGYEAGIPNCVSVPSGAEDMTWVDSCYDWMQKFEAIYLFGDNDEPGLEMINRLKVKLSDHRLFMVEHEYKDCNELFYRKGKEAVYSAYTAAKEISVEGLLNFTDITPFDVKNVKRVMSGIQEMDRDLGGFLLGELTIWTGKRNEGKSTLVGQMMVEAVSQGQNVCIYSGEMRADRVQYWIALQTAGANHISTYYDQERGKDVYYVDKPKLDAIKAWYNRRMWVYDNNIAGSNEESSIFRMFEYAAKRYDCKVFMVDNLMTCEYSQLDERNYYRAQSCFVGKLVNFAKVYNCHVHLVAHPRKTSAGIENDDISGSAEISNRADNCVKIERVKDDDKATVGYDAILSVIKSRSDGARTKVGMNYDPASRRLYVPTQGNKREYGWVELYNTTQQTFFEPEEDEPF